MAKTVPNTVGPLRDLNGIELFAVGDHHGTGKPFTLEDLKEVERNFYSLLESSDAHHDPAGCLGHEEDQAHLKAIIRDDAAYQAYVETMDGSDVYHIRTGQPAAGHLRDVRLDESTGKLVGDLKGIPPSIADMIDAGLLRYPSLAFYDPFEANGKRYGFAIRHVALLGADPPGVKSLAPFGKTEPAAALAFSERVDRFGRYFSEVHMTKPELIAALRKKHPTLAEKYLDTLTAEVLQTMHDAEAAPVEPPAPTPAPPAPEPTPTPIAGNPPTPAPPVPTPGPTPEVVPAAAFAEWKRQLNEFEARQRQLEAEQARRGAAERKGAVRAYCDRWVAEGKITPAEADDQSGARPDQIVPNVYLDGIRASATRAYCDGGISEFDAWVKRHESLPEGAAGPVLGRRTFADHRVVQPMQKTDLWAQLRERAKTVRGVDQPGKTLEQRMNMLPARSAV
jgi:hypothetical protein